MCVRACAHVVHGPAHVHGPVQTTLSDSIHEFHGVNSLGSEEHKQKCRKLLLHVMFQFLSIHFNAF